jgi:hypothetical protein
MGADNSLKLMEIETYASQFFGLNKLFLGSVHKFLFKRWHRDRTLLKIANVACIYPD